LLSPNFLRGIKPAAERTEYADDAAKGGVRGLWLRVSPATGPKTWILRMRDGEGQTRRFTLGAFPALGLSDAREAARQMQQQVRHQKRDPVEEGRQARARAKVVGDGTLEGLVTKYYFTGRGATLRTSDEQKARILAVFAGIAGRALPSLTPNDLRLAVQAYPAKSAAGSAAAYLKAVLRRLGEDDPHLLVLSTKLKRPEPVREESRHLSETEVRKLLRALPPVGSSGYGDALWFFLWTGARRSEVTGAHWAEFDLTAGEWTVPAGRMKATRESARRAHMRKLPRQALALLAARAPTNGRPKADGFVFTGKTGGTVENWDRYLKALQDKAAIAPFSCHDLRRTAATLARELGTAEDAIDKGMLAHTPPPLARIYIRAGLEREAGQAMQRLADHYDTLLSENAQATL
jgi:integrase